MGRKSGQPLTRERIINTAMRLVDERGLSELSMRKLGDALGVHGMALYHHFPSKTVIIDELVGDLLGRVDLAADETGWVARIRRIHESQRQHLLSHPNLLPAAIMRPFNTPAAVRISDTVLDVLLSAGFDEEAALHAYQTLRAYVLGYTLTETVGLLGDPPRWDNRDRLSIQEYGTHGFTSLLRVVPVAAVYDHDEEFTTGLEALIDGLKLRLAEVRRRAATDEPRVLRGASA